MKRETKAGKALSIRVGEMSVLGGVFKMLAQQLQLSIGYLEHVDKLEAGPPNTAFAHHQKKTYALMEAVLPFNIKIAQSEKSFDIKSIGFETFNGQLKHNVSAHPKTDYRTGEFCAFGYDM
jgi:carotenoid cleavage dioxygenase-like enzyme